MMKVQFETNPNYKPVNNSDSIFLNYIQLWAVHNLCNAT